MSLLYQNNNYLIISSINPDTYFKLNYIINNIDNRKDYETLINESFEYANHKIYECEFNKYHD